MAFNNLMREFWRSIKHSLPVLLLVASSACRSGAGEADTAAQEACNSEQSAQCQAAYKQASGQCGRYYLKETEAYSMCQVSAQKRFDLCTGQIENTCAESDSGNPRSEKKETD